MDASKYLLFHLVTTISHRLQVYLTSIHIHQQTGFVEECGAHKFDGLKPNFPHLDDHFEPVPVGPRDEKVQVLQAKLYSELQA